MQTIFQNILDTYNTSTIREFEGLTPQQMQSVLYDLFGENCPIILHDKLSNETLDEIKFFRLCEEFLKIIQRENALKLTPKGNLQKKVVIELYEHRLITDFAIESGIFKNFIENEIDSIHNTNLICQIAGVIKKSNNSLTLTTKGIKLINTAKRNELFKLVLETFIKKFSWCYNDNYSDQMTGQFGIGYVLILLMMLGNEERSIQFYGDKYLAAFPNIIDNFIENECSTPLNDFYNCFAVRVFDRFLYWFGLVNVVERKEKWHSKNDIVVIWDVMHDIFLLKI